MDKYIFSSENLGFRTWSEDDLDEFVWLNKNPQVMRFMPTVLSRSETISYYGRIKEHFENWGYGLYAVDHLADQKFIGYIGFQHTGFDSFFTPCLEIGFRLNPKYWGQGYATEGSRACIEHAFNEMEIEKVCSFTAIINKQAERVMIKLGMKRVDEFSHPKVNNVQLKKCVVYTVTKEEFFD